MKMPANRAVLIASLAMLIVACEDEAAPELEDGEVEASGEVLEGTISDAMIPLDELQSQAPLAEPDAEEASETGEGDSQAESPAE